MTRQLTKRGQWLTMLAKLTSPMESTAAAQAFNAYTPMLEQFPDEAFTIPSLEFVAGNCKHGVPTYADLRQHLAAWWHDNRPASLLIGNANGLDEDGQRWLAYFRKREAEHFRNGDGKPPSSRQHVLSLVKQQSLAAWARITGESIAPRPEPTDEEKAAVRQIVASLKHELNLPKPLPSHSLADQIAVVRQTALDKAFAPKPLAPEVLAAARAQAGIKPANDRNDKLSKPHDKFEPQVTE